MISFKQFVGIDISKKTFDAAITMKGKSQVIHQCFSQSKKGNDDFIKWLRSHNATVTDTLICMEHTGLYTEGLIKFLVSKKANIWVQMAVKIKRSMGLQRGGNDKASAIMIADYALRFSDKARLWKPIDTKLSALRDLIVQRDRIVNALKQLRVPLEELKSCDFSREVVQMEKLQKPAMDGLKKALQAIEAATLKMIVEDEQMNESIQLITSIKGVGIQTAASLYAYTKGFTMFENAKQLACYCGVVPFAKSSGTSVRYKPGVSPFANRKLKSLLHLCAMSALRFDKNIKAYYERKIEEGKNKMSVINAIRNKLVHRIFAVLRDGRPYVENYVYARA
jgi:transposase